MNIPRWAGIVAAAVFFILTPLYAQDFGFGFDDEAEAGGALPFSVKVGGEIGVRFLGFVHDFGSAEKLKAATLGDVISGKLNFSASGANVDAVIRLNLSAASFGDLAASGQDGPYYTPLILDEAYLQAYLGPVSITGGLRKLTWGKADSLGPLDVVNPLDYTNLTNITDVQTVKIARPMAHVSWNMDDGFSRLEAVFIPTFTGYRFAQDGRWAAAEFTEMYSVAEKGIIDRATEQFGPLMSNPDLPIDLDDMFAKMRSKFVEHFNNNPISFPSTGTLEYLQAGLRFTTTIGSSDLGAQYFYGNMFRPDFSIPGVDDFLGDFAAKVIEGELEYTGNLELLVPQLRYSRYHQIGLDYAQVFFGFNLRSELALHLTEDVSGDDGSVKNPFIAWSVGFDRDLFWGINANIQCNETIRLMNTEVGINPILDCEAGTDITSTRLTIVVTKRFLKDNLESRATVIWDIEDSGCYILPGILWNIRDLTAELSAGVFVGKEQGELGQYWENSFIKVGLKYSF